MSEIRPRAESKGKNRKEDPTGGVRQANAGKRAFIFRPSSRRLDVRGPRIKDT